MASSIQNEAAVICQTLSRINCCICCEVQVAFGALLVSFVTGGQTSCCVCCSGFTKVVASSVHYLSIDCSAVPNSTGVSLFTSGQAVRFGSHNALVPGVLLCCTVFVTAVHTLVGVGTFLTIAVVLDFASVRMGQALTIGHMTYQADSLLDTRSTAASVILRCIGHSLVTSRDGALIGLTVLGSRNSVTIFHPVACIRVGISHNDGGQTCNSKLDVFLTILHKLSNLRILKITNGSIESRRRENMRHKISILFVVRTLRNRQNHFDHAILREVFIISLHQCVGYRIHIVEYNIVQLRLDVLIAESCTFQHILIFFNSTSRQCIFQFFNSIIPILQHIRNSIQFVNNKLTLQLFNYSTLSNSLMTFTVNITGIARGVNGCVLIADNIGVVAGMVHGIHFTMSKATLVTNCCSHTGGDTTITPIIHILGITVIAIVILVVAIKMGLCGSGFSAADGAVNCGCTVVVVCIRLMFSSCRHIYATVVTSTSQARICCIALMLAHLSLTTLVVTLVVAVFIGAGTDNLFALITLVVLIGVDTNIALYCALAVITEVILVVAVSMSALVDITTVVTDVVAICILVAECIDDFLFLQNFVADRAFHARSKAGIRTGCRHCRDCLTGVSLSIHYKSCLRSCGCSCCIQEEDTTIITAALVMFLVSGFSTSGCLSLHLFERMTQRINVFGIGMRCIIFTGKGLFALSCAGRLNGNFTLIVLMADCRDSLCRNGGCLVAGSILEYTVTSVTGVVCIVTGCRTGFTLRFGQRSIVAKSINLTISGVVTLLAILICIPTDLRTGGCLRSHCCDIVASSSDGHLRNGSFIFTGFIGKHLVTGFACIVCIVTGRCTGCFLSCGKDHAVTKRSDGHLRNGSFIFTGFILKYLATNFASIVFIVASCCTGCFLSCGKAHAVTKRSDGFLFNQNIVADGAFHTRSKSGIRTGCRHCRNFLLGMTLSGNILCFRSLFLCPIENKGCGVLCPALFRAGSRCLHNTLYVCFNGFNMSCIVATYMLSGTVEIAIGPFIDSLTVCMTLCSNVFNFLSLLFYPFNIKCCRVSRPALFRTGRSSCFFSCYSCCCSLNMTTVSRAHTLSGADPNAICSVILPARSCSCKAMAECIPYSNSLVSTHHITTVALHFASCRICTGSFRIHFTGRFRSETMTQLGIFLRKSLSFMYICTAFTHYIVFLIVYTSGLFSQLRRKQGITMTQSGYFVCLIAITAFAGVGGIATLGTSRCRYGIGVRMLMCLCGNDDDIIFGNIVNVDIDHLTIKLRIVHLCNTGIRNVYAIANNGYLHNQGRILQFQVCIECLTHYNSTSCTFHSGYASHIVVGNVYMIVCVQRTVVTNRRFKCIRKNFHTLDIGMEPVFHQVFKALFIRLDTDVFDINQMNT